MTFEIIAPFREDMALAEAKAIMRTLVKTGATCPCCTQHAKIYRRKLNAGMARSLIKMYQSALRSWQHIPTTVGGKSREEGKLRYWGLVEEESDLRREDGGRAGYWRVTEKGEAWLHGDITVPSHAVVYAKRLLRLEGDPTTVAHALGKPFNFREMMGDRAIDKPTGPTLRDALEEVPAERAPLPEAALKPLPFPTPLPGHKPQNATFD